MYTSEEQIPYEELYCDACGDSDSLFGVYDPDSFKSALQFVLDVSENSYTNEYIMQTVTSLFNLTESAKISLYKVVSDITTLYDEYISAQFDAEMPATDVTDRSVAEVQDIQKDATTYDVCIIETLQRVVKVDAETATDAVNIANDLYNASEIVLTADDHKTTDIFVCT